MNIRWQKPVLPATTQMSLCRISMTSLASQTPYFSEERERGSGNTAYRKFCQAKECGASNQIASF